MEEIAQEWSCRLGWHYGCLLYARAECSCKCHRLNLDKAADVVFKLMGVNAADEFLKAAINDD